MLGEVRKLMSVWGRGGGENRGSGAQKDLGSNCDSSRTPMTLGKQLTHQDKLSMSMSDEQGAGRCEQPTRHGL